MYSVLCVTACFEHSSILPDVMTMRTAKPRNSKSKILLGSKVPAVPFNCSNSRRDMAVPVAV